MGNSVVFNTHKFLSYMHRAMYRKFNKKAKKRLTSVFEYLDVPYSADANHKHKFDVYVPASTGERMHPMLVYLHGGNYLTGDKTYSMEMAKKLASMGMVVFSCNYSLAPDYTMSKIETDVVMAIEEAMNIAELYNADYNAVFVGGEGVGAGLASRTVANIIAGKYADYLADFIVGTIGIAGKYDLSLMKQKENSLESKIVDTLIEDDNIELYDSKKYITAKYPQTLVICGDKEVCEKESSDYVAVLKKKKVKHKYVTVEMNKEKTTVDTLCGKDTKACNTVTLAVKEFLKEILG